MVYLSSTVPHLSLTIYHQFLVCMSIFSMINPSICCFNPLRVSALSIATKTIAFLCSKMTSGSWRITWGCPCQLYTNIITSWKSLEIHKWMIGFIPPDPFQGTSNYPHTIHTEICIHPGVDRIVIFQDNSLKWDRFWKNIFYAYFRRIIHI